MIVLIALFILSIGVLFGYLIGIAVAKRVYICRACEWLKAYDVTFTETPSMLEDFRKAMEE